MNNKIHRKLAVKTLSALIAASACSGAVHAQNAGKQSALEEIVVTATRREESLQEVPITMSAFTGDMLDDAGVTDTSQLGDVTPGMVIAKSSIIFTPSIRGIGSRALLMGDESNIGVYIDGIYQAAIFAGTIDLVELERVEVLRGPQGTLFGRNSTGGLINLITKKPAFESAGNLSLTYGRYHQQDARLYYTTGLTETMAADVALGVKSHRGFIDNLENGGKAGEQENYSIRTNLLMDWTPDTQAILTLSGIKQNDNLAATTTLLGGNTAGNTTGATPLATRAWESSMSFSPVSLVKQHGISLRTSTQFSGFDLETTASYQRNDALSITDSDSSPADVQRVETAEETNDYTLEVRLLSDNDTSLKWITGLFAIHRQGQYEPLQVNTFQILNEFETDSIAGFAEGTYAFNDQWSLTAGARYTWEERYFRNRRASGPFDDTTSWNELSPKVSLQYFYSDTGNLYATYSRGFKSGVYNGSTSSPPAIVVDPEIVDAYEIGIKAEPLPWLRTNVAAYYYDYQDIQLSQFDTTSGFIRLANAATSEIKGLEFEILASVTDNLDVRVAGNFMDAKFDDFPGAGSTATRFNSSGVPIGNDSTITVDASGFDMIRAPDYSLNLGINYGIPLNDGLLTLQSNVLISDDYFFTPDNRFGQDGYTKVGAQASWAPDSGSYEISLWGQNLTNEKIQGHVVSGTTADYTWYQPPRTYGVTVDFNF